MIDLNKEYTLSRQLLRSGTSIGANICESVRACNEIISILVCSLKTIDLNLKMQKH